VTPNAERAERLDVEAAYQRWLASDSEHWLPHSRAEERRLAFAAGFEAALRSIGMFTEAG